MRLNGKLCLVPGRRARSAAQAGTERKGGKKAVAFGCMLALMLTGCGHVSAPESVSETTLAVDKSGALTYYLVGDFEKEYYDLAELTAMAREEASSFGGAKETGGVSLEKVELLQDASDKVSVVYQFDSGESFSEFTGSSFFYGTVSQAFDLGYDPGDGLESVKDGSVKSKEQLKQDGEKRLIITDARALIYCPVRVSGLSGGAKLTEDGSVDATAAEGMIWILLK